MISAPSVQIPGGRVLAAWWRGLASLRPSKLWFGNLLFHSFEVPVRLKQAIPLDRFPFLVLQGIDNAPDKTPLGVALFLSLNPSLLVHVLKFLENQAFIEMQSSGSWTLSRQGNEALQVGSYSTFKDGRKEFCFVQLAENSDPIFVLAKPGAFKNSNEIHEPTASYSLLHNHINQTSAWKKHHHFPEEVVELLAPFPRNGQESARPTNFESSPLKLLRDWQSVAVVQCWRQNVAVVSREGTDGSKEITGFAVHAPQWELRAAEPLFGLIDEKFSELVDEPSASMWFEAWREWCQPRGLLSNDTNQCTLERVGHQLKVSATKRIMDQLHVQRSDALKGDAWLTAGTGILRPVAQLHVVEKGAKLRPASTH
jgi:hypothetical protein